MKLVRIDRSSIKKNPNAGATVTYVPMGRDFTFETTAKEIPEWLKECVNMETIWKPLITKGIIHDPALIDQFEAWAKDEHEKNGTVSTGTLNSHSKRLFHAPEPIWLYQYENTPIKCLECGKETDILDIDTEIAEPGGSFTICLHCNETDSFEEFEFEDFDPSMGLAF